jgi:hypothetical protein
MLQPVLVGIDGRCSGARAPYRLSCSLHGCSAGAKNTDMNSIQCQHLLDPLTATVIAAAAVFGEALTVGGHRRRPSSSARETAEDTVSRAPA